mmetsp:Transcript_26937/g.68478  ORF Transcript_26937/g.68478 Transcript_26937/m.68478 type:complete len:123 (+) Transcript_26937:170-538(+)
MGRRHRWPDRRATGIQLPANWICRLSCAECPPDLMQHTERLEASYMVCERSGKCADSTSDSEGIIVACASRLACRTALRADASLMPVGGGFMFCPSILPACIILADLGVVIGLGVIVGGLVR